MATDYQASMELLGLRSLSAIPTVCSFDILCTFFNNLWFKSPPKNEVLLAGSNASAIQWDSAQTYCCTLCFPMCPCWAEHNLAHCLPCGCIDVVSGRI